MIRPASPVSEDGDDIHLRHSGQRYRPPARLTRWARSIMLPVPVIPEVLRGLRSGCSPNSTARPGNWSDSMPSFEDRVRGPPRASWKSQTTRLLESEQRRQSCSCRRQNGFLGLGLDQRRLDVGRRAIPDFRRRFAKALSSIRPMFQALLHPDDIDELRKAVVQFKQGRSNPTKPSFESFGPDGEIRWCVGTAAADPSTRPGRVIRVQRRYRRYYRAETGGRATESSDPGRSDHRAKKRRWAPGAINCSADTRRKRQGLPCRRWKDGSVRSHGSIPFSLSVEAGRARK